MSPACTFNVVLCLVGNDVGVLKSAQQPVWPYDGSAVVSEAQKSSQTPKSWMTSSAVWYSKQLAHAIGQKVLQDYMVRFFYGNQDLWGSGGKDGFASAHLSSTLMISPAEQVQFLQRLLTGSLPVSAHAVEVTRELLYDQTFPSGWALYGKTGSGWFLQEVNKIAWYVGWVEKGAQKYPFALLMAGLTAFPTKEERQELVKQYFREALIPL